MKKSHLLLSLALILCTNISLLKGQEKPQTSLVGPEESSVSPNYREPRRDPFRDEKLLISPPTNKKPQPIATTVVDWPSYTEREAAWQKERKAARQNGTPSPAISQRYLIDELQIVGIYKKDNELGIFIKPTPTAHTTFFAKVGDSFYNGQLKRIDGLSIEFEERSLLSTNKLKVDKRIINFQYKR